MQFGTNISSYEQLLHTTAFNILPELSTVCAKRRKWENGGMGKWGNGKMGEWGNGGMGEWENGKMGKWGNL
jgi:hypothetical protein